MIKTMIETSANNRVTPFKLSALSSAVIAVLAGASVPSLAQDDFFLEEIVVTATKRETNLQDTPIAISAFNADSMEELGIQNAQDLVQHTPGLTIHGTKVTIRGIGREQSSVGSDPGVSFNINGRVVTGDNIGVLNTSDMWDVAQVEVLRGPQGTLFGRNTVGGAINFTTAAPTKEFEGAVEIEAGNYNSRETKLMLSGSLSEKIQGRLALFSVKRDGYQTNIADDRDFYNRNAQGGTVSFNIDWSDKFSSQFVGMGSSSRYRPEARVVTTPYNTTSIYLPNATVNPNFLASTPNPSLNDIDTVNLNGEMRGRLDEWSATLTNVLDVEGGTVKYIAGYSHWKYDNTVDADKSGVDLYSQINEVNDSLITSQSHEIQFLSDWSGPLQLVAGVFYYDETYDQRYSFEDSIDGRYNRPIGEIDSDVVNAYAYGCPYPTDCNLIEAYDGGQYASGVPSAFLGVPAYEGDPSGNNSTFWLDDSLDTVSTAVFGQLEYSLSEALTLTFGLRYSEDEKTVRETDWLYLEDQIPGVPTVFEGEEFTIGAGGMPAPGGRAVNYFLATTGTSGGFGFPVGVSIDWENESNQWDSVDGRLGLDYAIDNDQMVYAYLATGYRSGGYSVGGNFQEGEFPAVEPESLLAYEVGYKGTVLDGRGRVNAAAYYYDYEDMQLKSNELNATTNTILPVFKNAASASIAGLDLEYQYLLTESFHLSGTYSYSDATYDEFSDVNTLTSGDNPVLEDLSGNRLNRIPEHKYSLSGIYSLPFLTGELSLLASYSWTGEMYTSQFNTDIDRLDNYDRINLRATWVSSDERVSIVGFANNVGDTRGALTVTAETQANGGAVTKTFTTPRTFGAKVNYHF
mgnify:CR=1 FL=1